MWLTHHPVNVFLLGFSAGAAAVVSGEPALLWAVADPGLSWAAAGREAEALTWSRADPGLTWQSRGTP